MKVIEFKTNYGNCAAPALTELPGGESREVSVLDRRDGDQALLRGGGPAPTKNAPAKRSLGAWILLGFLRLYIVCLSPMLGGACKFYPSCSNYAIEAVSKHGARRGFVLAAKRLLRCRPFTQGGFDPVPDDLPHTKQTRRANRKLQVVSGTELKIRATERRML
jgi:uncharacterized protein